MAHVIVFTGRNHLLDEILFPSMHTRSPAPQNCFVSSFLMLRINKYNKALRAIHKDNQGNIHAVASTIYELKDPSMYRRQLPHPKWQQEVWSCA
eukprot:1148363-Pelagomonas_calceolata.AAC.3